MDVIRKIPGYRPIPWTASMRGYLSERGMALLLTILIVSLLSIFILEISDRSRLSFTRAANSIDSLKAFYIMRSGVSAAMGFLEKDGRETGVDRLTEEWAQGIESFPVSDGVVSVRIVDESSRFNINDLVNSQGVVMDRPPHSSVERFGRLLRNLELDETISQKAANWLRDNRKDFSYSFLDLSELLLVPGVTPETYDRIRGYVTIHTNRGENTPKININTVRREVLASLSGELTDSMITSIIDYRKEHPLTSITEIKKIQGIDDTILNSFSDLLSLDGRSSWFSVYVEARVGDSVKKAAAVVNRTGSGRITAWRDGEGFPEGAGE